MADIRPRGRRTRCSLCGRHGETQKPVNEYVCRRCLVNGEHLALRGHRKVLDGLIWRFVPDPDVEPEPPPLPLKQQCGQSQGARRHRRSGEKPCPDCARTEANDQARRRKQRAIKQQKEQAA